MPEARYAQAQRIAHDLLELVPEQRAAGIERACGADIELRREVEWLIEVAEDTSLDAVPTLVHAAEQALTSELYVQNREPGRFQLIEPIGEGGMGVVWLAEREVSGVPQRVALKRLHSGTFAHRSRLLEEQRILSTLVHPNIARLLDAGVDLDGAPFLVMELVVGERIDRWCFGRKLDLHARLDLFLKTCSAVAHAHQQLIIHRDIKPANVLVDAAGEPKLLDFGIARLIDEEGGRNTASQVMTPAYASPEQLEGRMLGTTTDVWSLGALLYELLSGQHPFGHLENTHARASAVLAGALTPPSQAARRRCASPDAGPAPSSLRIPADIDAIVLKAMRREPAQRYGSVQELAADLRRFLSGQPVLARRGQWGYRARRFVLRNRWPVLAACLLALTATGFTWRTVLAEREARLQAVVAEQATDFLVSAFSLSDPAQAGRHDYSAREVLDRGRDRVNAELATQPQVRARLLEALGNAYRGINENSAGAELLEAAAQLNLAPAVHNPLAAARSLRAKSDSILASNGSTQAAEDAARRAFDLVQVYAHEDPLALADAYGTWAAALDGIGRERQAVAAAREALKLREQANASPLRIADSLVALCTTLSGASDHMAGRPFCERALTLYAAAGAARSNAFRLALRRLESVLVYSGQYERGLAIARQRLELTAELFGPESSVLATERVQLTDRLAEHGLFAEASQMLALGMPVILARNGAGSSQYAKALFYQGWLDYLQGRFDAALPPMRRALAIHEDRVDGQDRGMLQVLRTTLAQVLIESGRADAEARALLEQVIAERSRGDTHAAALAYARLPMAQWHAARGEAAHALALLAQVASAGPGVEQELHARAAATRAALLRTKGDTSGAALWTRKAFETMQSDRGRSNPRTVRYALAYAQAARAAGAEVEAQRLEREYRPRLLRLYPADSVFMTLAAAPP